MPEFERVLIANRGEIAVRVIRTLKALGISSVAIFSDADTDSVHVSMADRAYRLPGVYPSETYLNAGKILEVARISDCDAIHPGYGFLSERSEFSKLCRENSVKFIGPSPETLALSGNKLECKKLVESLGVPVIPYSKEPLNTAREAAEFASSLGYPVLLKSAFGGGGRGIKEARSTAEVKEAFESSQREAMSSFGRFSVFVEKKILNPRHIEVQILGSPQDMIHLGERECSIQRRYQKLVEISPSPIIDESSRARVTDYAKRAAGAVGYSNAGTVEFLRDGESGELYFIEINSRLQVEHPVTEMVTGIDLVNSQIQVAASGRLPLRQEDVHFSGCAIECRINAEDSLAGFAPATGQVRFLHIPGGPGVRVDSALRVGAEVTPYYDSLVAKLICWGQTFDQARRRAVVALDEFTIAGFENTIPFHRVVLSDASFALGRLGTNFIDQRNILQTLSAKTKEEELTTRENYTLAALLISLKNNEGSGHRRADRRKDNPARPRVFYKREGRFADAL